MSAPTLPRATGYEPAAAPDAALRPGRLVGRVALVTGAAGNIGTGITRRYLEEGATVIMTGRDEQRLATARAGLLELTGADAARASCLVMDGADPAQVRRAVAEAMARYGRLDVVVNNAGSAGPRQRILDVPLTAEELEALRAAGATDTESARDAVRNLLGVAWNVARCAAPHLRHGASLINVSTIFSRTEYFGRAAYVVPKAALNALSRRLATELGARGIRVNTVFPGPIAGERIRSVFSSMDRLREAVEGTTAGEMLDLMTLARKQNGRGPERVFPTVDDVANVIVFLGSDEAGAIHGHDLEVTHGMTVRKESRSTWVSRPELRTVDGAGIGVMILAGDQAHDALAVARVQARCGAEVLLALAEADALAQVRASLGDAPSDRRITPVLADRREPATIAAALRDADGGTGRYHTAIVLPAHGAGRLAGDVSTASDATVTAFLDDELVGALAAARELTRYWTGCAALERTPRVVFLTNGDDGRGNVYADALRAAMEELVRVWRQESDLTPKADGRRRPDWGNQIIRYTNDEDEGLLFAAGQAARLLFTERHIRQVNLYLPHSIREATGARRATLGWMENLLGLHIGKVALVTGGSSGIGGQIGRLLAAAGARVLLVARGEESLVSMRNRIVEELEGIGYAGARRRVQILAGCDVGELGGLERAVDVTLAQFGRLDYLVNCAGVAGAEEMVVDMDVEAWRYTLDANLVSNYALIQKVVPVMKRQGTGYIVNVSSYFGGEKYVAAPYPNRADYAVSKAGQRALAENLARFLGPEIQINAVAPGPVEGDRLRGAGGKPGLFERRAKLILENKRLNALHAGVVEAIRQGEPVGALLDHLAPNSVAALRADPDVPEALMRMADEFTADARDGATCGQYLMTRPIARKLVDRLRRAGHFLREEDLGERFGPAWVEAIPQPPEPFLPGTDLAREAAKVRAGVLSLLHLRKMPTEHEVAIATVFFMADRAVSGETFQPSGGLHLERSITERELFGSAKRERLAMLRGRTVWLIGEHLVPHLARAATAFAIDGQVERIVLLTRTAAAGRAVLGRLSPTSQRLVRCVTTGDDLEGGMDAALREGGAPTAIVSTPFAPLPDALFGDDGAPLLDTAGFRDLVEVNLTHHFRVARKAALFDDVQLMLVSPDVAAGGGAAAFALANFVKTTLHALTGTLAVECERLVHDAVVNQINLTRRVRSEEPRDEAETVEELERFARAVLLAGAPLPDLEDSRYRSRIYRGMAITV